MGVRTQLEKKIEAQEKEIDNLKAEIQRKESFLSGLKEALKLLPREDSEVSSQELRPGSDLAKASELLKQAGHPLHISEILKGLGKEVNKNTRASLSGSMGTYARKREIFVKSGPNTFGLVEHRRKEPRGSEPPDDFGIDDPDSDDEKLDVLMSRQ